MNTKIIPCAHDACTCTVDKQGAYCSDACRKAKPGSDSAEDCRCGHEDCEASDGSNH